MAGTKERGPSPATTRFDRPLQPISSEGRIAGYTTSISFLVVGMAYTAMGFMFVGCVEACRIGSGTAAFLLLVFIPLTALGVWGVQNVARRSVRPTGFAAWRFGLSVLFVLGVFAAVSRIPNATCIAGFHVTITSSRYQCVGPTQTTFHHATSWTWLKGSIVLGSIAVGVTVIPMRQFIRVTSVVAATAWFAGAALLAAAWFS